ncbi:MAG: ABC transporter ATP-binding protein [Myxococcota bacterium]|nr:ABC transporter ATP-binding protein [Myxococcota bacterium]MDW8360800.1 ABC transporter ATP-binding protein [Myxococcales bacterium]
MAAPLLEVRDLAVAFHTDEGVVRAVDGVDLDVAEGATLGLVGESGCGKSVTSLALLRLLPEPAGRIERGSVRFEGRDLLALSEREMCRIRGDRIAMIFQEPASALNPVYTVGDQIAEALRLHRGLGRKAARARAIELLAEVGIPAPAERVHAYPHQLSGGMRQRVMIAMALCCRPRLLIADEPTTALDVTIQAQILDLLGRLQRELGMSVILITHDLGVVAELAEQVVVMYAGKVVERAPTRALFAEPLHPYTQGLMRSVPGFGDNARARRLPTIPGVVPDLRALPPGCRFADRCDRVEPACRQAQPPLVRLGHREVACFVVAREAGVQVPS